MGRKRRDDPEHGWHHVVNRGAKRELIFFDDADRSLFVKLLGEASLRFGTEVAAFCLMGNHYHLLLYCPDGGLSQTVHHIASNYVRAFNSYHGFDGPMFRGRFANDDPICSDDRLLRASRYIHRNPLELGLRIDPYPWSSYACFSGDQPAPLWLKPDLVVGLAGGPTEYRRYVETDQLGEKLLMARGRSIMAPQPRPDLLSPTLAEVDSLVAKAARVDVLSIHQVRRGARNRGRSIALLVAGKVSGLGLAQIAEHYGLGSARAASNAVNRAEAMVKADAGATEVVRTVLASLRRRYEGLDVAR